MDPVTILVLVFIGPIVLGVAYGIILQTGHDPANVMAPEDYDEPE